MNIYFKELNNKHEWENFLKNSPQENFLQSFNWGETHQKINHKIFRFGFYSGSDLKGLVLLIKQSAKRGNYLECPAGPIIDWEKRLYFEKFISLIRQIGHQENCIFVRVRPQISDSLNNYQLFRENGFVKAPMHLHAQNTWVLDISQKEEEILKGMRKTTRYLIRKALKDQVKIIQSDNINDIDILNKLQQETAARHSFVPFPVSYFKAHFETFQKDNQIKIFKAIWKDKPLSVAMIVFYHDRAVYHYSASTSKYNNIPASYLIQWEAIKEAKKRGCRWYDFWGIAPAGSGPNHRFAGVTLFKQGFGGKAINYLPAHDLPLRLTYWLNYLFESYRRVSRRL